MNEIACLLVYAYCKQAHRKLLLSSISIPDLVSNLCLTYYLFRDDYFEIAGKNIIIKNNGKSITKTCAGKCNTSYGYVSIPSLSNMLCIWDIYIDHLTDYYQIYGITSCHTDYNKAFHENKTSYNYSLFASDGQKIFRGRPPPWRDYGQEINEGDTVRIELNLKDKTIKFYKNSKDFGIAFKNVKCANDIYYKLAICIYGDTASDDTVSIANFEATLLK